MIEEQVPEAEDQADPAYDKAYEWVKQKLYGEELADKIVGVARSETDAVPLLTEMAYNLTAAADEATNGEVAEENLVPLGALALGEVFEVATAAGAELGPADMAGALKQMVVRYLQEQGVPPDQIKNLQQSMNQVSAEQFNQIAQEVPRGE